MPQRKSHHERTEDSRLARLPDEKLDGFYGAIKVTIRAASEKKLEFTHAPGELTPETVFVRRMGTLRRSGTFDLPG
ncbi:hypothetical protein JX265_007939 [Neoarthrinium moseri]|uniref:Uncharacterized protein n=1 Tax=Neoarthrinium moseri TaxID=1658444 RepID=A0A9Q0AMY3_9PEZI|nr:hypothetical protein JX266_004549 [Neoarthrinium moseri]KAI1865616.1 hypothetical protein JX265_007939 [Neoarthrinium moseri]